MVEADSIDGRAGDQKAGDAAQALKAILQTQYLRYLIIASWAVGLLGVIGGIEALVWFVGTLAAGALRGVVERRVSRRVDKGWGLIFPAVATITTAAWAVAPLLAWFSDNPFGSTAAIALLIGGYVLVFAQLRSSPRQAFERLRKVARSRGRKVHDLSREIVMSATDPGVPLPPELAGRR